MKLDIGLILASAAAILVAGAVGSSLLSLKQAEATATEVADARRDISEQARVIKRLGAGLAGKVTRTDAKVDGLALSLGEVKSQLGAAEASPSNFGSEAEASDTPASPEDEAEKAARAQQMSEAIEHAEALVKDAASAGRWTEQDRDRLGELLAQIDGPERRRIESSVGKLLVEGKLVTDGDFVPL